MGDGADFTRQRDLAEDDGARRHGTFGQRGDQSGGDREVGGGVGEAVAACDVEIDFGRGEADAAAGFEDREQHGEPLAVPADRAAPRGRARGKTDGERLDFDQHGARAFEGGEDGGARQLFAAFSEKQARRVGDFVETLRFHREDADLVGAAEAVLDGAQDAVLVRAFALEAEHGVDHMFEDARPRDIAVLGDVTDQHQRGAAFLGEADEFVGAGANLADCAGGALDHVAVHRLDRIDDEEIGRVVAQGGEDVAYAGGGGELDRRLAQPEAQRAQPDLVGRFLARDVDRVLAIDGEIGRDLQQQRRLADARIAPDQRGGGGHDPAAQRAVEFGDAGRHALGQRDLGVEPHHFDLRPAALQVMLLGEGGDDARGILDQRIPVPAIPALPLPARRDRPAGLTHITFLRFRHGLCVAEHLGNGKRVFCRPLACLSFRDVIIIDVRQIVQGRDVFPIATQDRCH